MHLLHVKYYNLFFLLDKDGANNADNDTDSHHRYCGGGRFIASHDAIYGSFVFTISK